MGGAAKTAKSVMKKPGRALNAFGTMGMSEMARKDPYGGMSNPLGLMGSSGEESGGVAGPFSLNAEQYNRNLSDITGLGKKQYDETLAGITDYGKAKTQRAKDLFAEMLPDIAENSQAAHLYDSTGYGNEVARQQSTIASQVAEEEAQKRFDALGGKQGFETSALQRGMSLEDFINQSNVAQAIGAQMAPQSPSGKATGLSGGVAGAGAGAPFGPIGAGIGGVGGLLLGSQANKRGK